MYFEIALICGLGIAAIVDLRTRKIPLQLIVGMIVIGVARVIDVAVNTRDIKDIIFQILIAMIPGLFMLLISYYTRQSIGYGDGLLVLTMGLYINPEMMISVIMLSMALAGVTALILIVFAKKSKNYEMAFCPFLVLGYATTLLL